MFLFGFIIFLFVYFFLQLIYIDHVNKEIISNPYKDERNFTLAYVIPDEVVETWKEDFAENKKIRILPLTRKRNSKEKAKAWNNINNYPSHCSKMCILESMFTPPSKKVEINWSVILGTYGHYHDENWKEFLVRTGSPLFVRLLVENMSETIVVSRKYSKIKKGKRNESRDDYKISLQTTLWLFTHESEFSLGESIVEHDIDGTSSKNIFFFPAPRILVHNKYKEKGNISIVYNFNEIGLNMTLISHDKFVISRRMFKRITD